ncbi:f616538a-9565-4903-9884-edb16bc51fd7 [Sclerotinia trifoliorum]|uniref:F616538a-9565-4903-9884-edb16bc51fd7 n=1 Tax=Sclerotinia trifoliorum TaxID=28548 RepID=A0A8H2VQY9_9HELO|nr:f616538a-9565-4903-9884-edb16bc51fd7 [Sclerotinia trifoliorum]
MPSKAPPKSGRTGQNKTTKLTRAPARFARIYQLAQARFDELRATDQSLEFLEWQLRNELKTHTNIRCNAAQICKGVLSRIRQARENELAPGTAPVSAPKRSNLPDDAPPVKPWVPKKIVVLKIKDGCFTPNVVPIPDTRVVQPLSQGPAHILWTIHKRNHGSCATPVAGIPTVISPTTLEYVGTDLTSDQSYYNFLARKAGAKNIIEARIKRGLEDLNEVLEEAIRRAHSLAESEVSILAGKLAEQDRDNKNLQE